MAKKAAKGKKIGRNKEKCKTYAARSWRNNRIRRITAHLKRVAKKIRQFEMRMEAGNAVTKGKKKVVYIPRIDHQNEANLERILKDTRGVVR